MRRAVLFLLAANAALLADVKLPALISDNMVIQRDAPVRIFGKADPGEAVTVRFHPAIAKLDGHTVVASCTAVPVPVAVRYAWGNDPPNNLVNSAGLPASPFRSDNWPDAVMPKF
jgi:hypothetical protein